MLLITEGAPNKNLVKLYVGAKIKRPRQAYVSQVVRVQSLGHWDSFYTKNPFLGEHLDPTLVKRLGSGLSVLKRNVERYIRTFSVVEYETCIFTFSLLTNSKRLGYMSVPT